MQVLNRITPAIHRLFTNRVHKAKEKGGNCSKVHYISMWESQHMSQGSAKPDINDDKIQLYNMRLCPFAERTVLVLLAKNIPFENINIDLSKKPDWFVESTLGKVPVILYKGKIVPESLITCDYLDEVFPDPKLHPEDPLQKAVDKVVVEKQSGMMRFLYPIFAKIPNRVVSDDEKLELFKNLVKHLESFESELKNRGTVYLGGNVNPNMADYMIWPLFERIDCLPVLMGCDFALPPELKCIDSWIKAMRSTKAVKKYGLSPERMAKVTSIHNETGGYDNALKESAGL